jgi:hypothetical protein
MATAAYAPMKADADVHRFKTYFETTWLDKP